MGCNVRLDCKDYTDNMKHPDCKKSTVVKNVKKYRGSKKGDSATRTEYSTEFIRVCF